MSGRSYLYQLAHSLSTPSFYLELLKAPWKSSFSFFLLSILWIGLLSGVLTIAFQLPRWNRTVEAIFQEVDTRFPIELIIGWNGTELEVSPVSLLAVPFPNSLELENSTLPPMLAYFSSTELQPDQLSQTIPTKTLAVVTPSQLFTSNRSDNWQSIPLARLIGPETEFVLNRQSITTYLDMVRERWQSAQPMVLALLLIFSPLKLLVTSGLSLILNAGLLYFFIRWVGLQLSYSMLVKLSLHVAVAGLLAQTLSQLVITPPGLNIFALVYWLFMLLILMTIKQQVVKKIATPQDQ